ncbi:TlpA family protein disulfide reductase [Chryseobacterium taklimakanense]|uniref:TlpA family protein disulfide reductase n=1 Tax=Chryseobacterium taklimakanense TaxID=536441 RepID=UPI000F5E47F2|nr:TlpA disulfide reductase family protein [Chryseobacterium taklimakanense]AZI23471.1 TlpA family protein disulfide reductase [Chryseobacterium taklimakanense]
MIPLSLIRNLGIDEIAVLHKMKFKSRLRFLTAVAFCFCQLLFSQISKTMISGKIIGEKDVVADTIIFTQRNLPNSESEKQLVSQVSKNSFLIEYESGFPKLYYYTLGSDKNDGIVQRKGDIFLDEKSSEIILNPNTKTEKIIGNTYLEYKEKFLPFFVLNKEKIDFTSIEMLINFDKDFESKLFSYVQENSNSYVALWSLILAINEKGYKKEYETILNTFGSEIKTNQLYHNVQDYLSNFRIKLGKKFPDYQLKTIAGDSYELNVPNGKTVLIDLWFSRCKPCLELIPRLKEIYSKHKDSRFEIISIATDQTKDIPILRKRIIEYGIPWINYLDENGFETKKDNINTFPANFLVEDGVIIEKNVTLNDLEIYLEKKRKPKS